MDLFVFASFAFFFQINLSSSSCSESDKEVKRSKVAADADAVADDAELLSRKVPKSICLITEDHQLVRYERYRHT